MFNPKKNSLKFIKRSHGERRFIVLIRET